MDNYIVSALKYRPTTFKSVVGQKALTQTLKNAISNNKLAHAYLFCGPRGVGKTTCARIFAKTINCTHITAEGDACNECESCSSFNEHRSLNIYELDAASNNSVEDIRALIEQVRIPPQSGKYKVYIIDEVHMLSSAAFNAFLKTLEEPPSYVIFILATTEKHKVLPTILSRCQVYDFSRISVQDIVDHLAYVAESEHIKADRDALNVIAMKADGGMRDSLSIFDQAASFTGGNITYQSVIENLNVLDYEYYFKLTNMLLENKVTDSLLLFNDILNKGFEGSRFISGLATHFRDLLVAHDPSTIPLLEVSDNIRQRYLEQAHKCPVKFLYRAIRLCNDCDMNYRANRNKRLLVELTLIELAQITSEDDAPSAGVTPKSHIKPIEKTTAAGQTQSGPAVASGSYVHPVNNTSTPHPAPSQKTMSEVLKSSTQKRNSVPKLPNISQLGVSILGTKENQQTEHTTQKVQTQLQQSLGHDTFDEGKLKLQVRRFASTLPIEQKALSLQFSTFLINLLDATHFEIVVTNELVLKEIGEVKRQLLQFVRNELNNGEVEMTIRVSEQGENKIPITRVEKYEHMVEKNKLLADLKNTFGLELS